MLLLWSLIVFLAVAVVLLLLIKIRSLVEEFRRPGKPRFGEEEKYADEARGNRQARMSGDAAYEQLEEERKSAQEMAEDRATMWP